MNRKTMSALIVAAGMMTFAEAEASERVSVSYTMPVRVQAALQTSFCENSTGPQVTLTGGVVLDGLGADLIFSNNEKGTHTTTEDVVAQVVLLPDGQTVSIPKQPSAGGTGGNPFIWVQLTDASGRALSGEIFLGRCVQGPFKVTADIGQVSTATADVAVGDCSHRGPSITLSGELTLTGLNARIIFRNNDNPVGGPHAADADGVLKVVIIPRGQSVTIPKQPVNGGVGGNPLISIQLKDGGNNPLGGVFDLGRCNQITQ